MIDQDVRNGLVFDMPVFGNANDYSGNGNHGVVTDATLTTDRYGRANKAYNFDINKYISASPVITGDELTIFIRMKVNTSDNASTRGIIGRTSDVFNANWGFQQIDKRLRAYIENSYIQWEGNTTGQWRDLVLWFQKPDIRIYSNGVMVASGTIDKSIVNNTQQFRIGGNPDLFRNFDASDARIYNKALSVAEILKLYKP